MSPEKGRGNKTFLKTKNRRNRGKVEPPLFYISPIMVPRDCVAEHCSNDASVDREKRKERSNTNLPSESRKTPEKSFHESQYVCTPYVRSFDISL